MVYFSGLKYPLIKETTCLRTYLLVKYGATMRPVLSVDPPEVRLADGTDSAGRLEVYVFGGYRVICTSEFDDRIATAACRFLGFR